MKIPLPSSDTGNTGDYMLAVEDAFGNILTGATRTRSPWRRLSIIAVTQTAMMISNRSVRSVHGQSPPNAGHPLEASAHQVTRRRRVIGVTKYVSHLVHDSRQQIDSIGGRTAVVCDEFRRGR